MPSWIKRLARTDQAQEGALILVLAAALWLAHFATYKTFGLYEDDLFRIPRVMGESGSTVWRLLIQGGGQGRPFHDGFIYLISAVVTSLGNLHDLYLAGYAILVLNAVLYYRLLCRISSLPIFILTGSLAFCLFPADTTPLFLTHAFGIQTSLTFLLLAIHCYLSGRRLASYSLIIFTLLIYESMFPLFAVAPLLPQAQQSSPQLKSSLIRHWIVMALLLISIVMIRKVMIGGVGVIGNLDGFTAARLSVVQMVLGPLVSMAMVAYRTIQTLLEFPGALLKPPPLYPWAWVVVVYFLIASSIQASDFNGGDSKDSQYSSARSNHLPALSRLALLGFTLVVLAYPLTFTAPATAISGRESRVHAAASVGGSMLVASVCTMLSMQARSRARRQLTSLCITTFFTSLVGFGLIVQQDYSVAWIYQQAFWTDLTRICPDIRDGTIILIDSSAKLRNPQQIQAHSWSMPVVLASIYELPSDWLQPPRVYVLSSKWREEVNVDGGFLDLSGTTNLLPFLKPAPRQRVASSEIIFLEAGEHGLERKNQPMEIDHHSVVFKQPQVGPQPELPRGPLYPYLIKDFGESRIHYTR